MNHRQEFLDRLLAHSFYTVAIVIVDEDDAPEVKRGLVALLNDAMEKFRMAPCAGYLTRELEDEIRRRLDLDDLRHWLMRLYEQHAAEVRDL